MGITFFFLIMISCHSDLLKILSLDNVTRLFNSPVAVSFDSY